MLGTTAAWVVAGAHIVFMIVETFLWTNPAIRARFGQSAEDAETTKLLAANQGVYNGMLGATLAWATWSSETAAMQALLVFVIVVGAYGGLTVKRSILVIQVLPALAALILTQQGI